MNTLLLNRDQNEALEHARGDVSRLILNSTLPREDVNKNVMLVFDSLQIHARYSKSALAVKKLEKKLADEAGCCFKLCCCCGGCCCGGRRACQVVFSFIAFLIILGFFIRLYHWLYGQNK